MSDFFEFFGKGVGAVFGSGLSLVNAVGGGLTKVVNSGANLAVGVADAGERLVNTGADAGESLLRGFGNLPLYLAIGAVFFLVILLIK